MTQINLLSSKKVLLVDHRTVDHHIRPVKLIFETVSMLKITEDPSILRPAALLGNVILIISPTEKYINAFSTTQVN